MSTTIFLLLIIAAVLIIARLSSVNVGKADAGSESSDVHSQARAVIGEGAFATMTLRVEQIMRRHRADKCVAVSLTTGADSGDSAEELHHLLPGDPLWLKARSEDGVDVVDVYSGGFKVGSLLLLDAEKAIEILSSSTVTGTYVCEQNCYEYYDKVALKIIIFYSTAEAAYGDRPAMPSPSGVEAGQLRSLDVAPYKLTVRNEESSDCPFTFFQN